jgi:aspartate racemase
MNSARFDHPVIGVLGGMGPEATVELMRRVIATTPAQEDADHIHMLVDNNPKVPSRIAALFENNDISPGPELARMAKRLTTVGASTLAMPCNTAHVYLPEIRAAAGNVPVLDMVALTASRMGNTLLNKRRVGVLASAAVKRIGLYDAALAKVAVEAVYAKNQTRIMEIIRRVKRGDSGTAARRQFADICEQLLADDCDLLLIACTEFSVIADALPSGVPSLDALDVLVESIVDCGRTRLPAGALPQGGPNDIHAGAG